MFCSEIIRCCPEMVCFFCTEMIWFSCSEVVCLCSVWSVSVRGDVALLWSDAFPFGNDIVVFRIEQRGMHMVDIRSCLE